MSSTVRIVLAMGEVFLSALVLMLLWRWNVADTFGVHRLTYGESFGLSILLAFVTYRYRDTRAWGNGEWADFIVTGYSTQALLLAAGAILEVTS